jgi:uncharacterized integral membrane protein
VRIVTWAIWLVVFLVLVGFVAKNVDPVTLRFYFDLDLQAPLIAILFAAFAAGSACGVLALVPRLLRQRREIARLRRDGRTRAEPPSPPVTGLQ